MAYVKHTLPGIAVFDALGTKPDQLNKDPDQTEDRLNLYDIPAGHFYDCSAFVITVTRAWFKIIQARILKSPGTELYDNMNVWTRKFCTLGGPQAAKHWDQFMECLAYQASRKIHLGCSCCGKVSSDETSILSALLDIQNLKIKQAKSQLELFIRDDHVTTALHHLVMFSEIMAGQRARIDQNVVTALTDKAYDSKQKLN